MKKILITGGTGFVGSNFAHKFLDLGYNVNLIVRKKSNFWRIESIKDKLKLHNIDLINAEEVEKFIGNLKPQIILHFAAYGAYQGRQQDVKTTIDTNLLGTINLVNACSKISFDCFINTGSSSEYGTKNRPMNENDLLEPNNLYGVTKAAATMYCQFLAKKTDLPLMTIRPFSLFGPLEDKNRLIPAVIRAFLSNSPPVLSSADFVRDFLYIDDIIDAYRQTIEKIESIKGNIFNISSGTQHSIGEVVGLIKNLMDSDLEPIYGEIEKAQPEPTVWVADISKAKKILGWEPKLSLEEGLRKNIEWFKRAPKAR